MAAPLTALECELLEAVAREPDDAALSVLGDYWLERGEEARGAFVHLHVGDNRDRIDLAAEEVRLRSYAHEWRARLVRAGYPESELALANGFLQRPLAVPAGHALDGDPDVVRISPRYYREHAVLREGVECTVLDGEAITPRTRTRVAIKAPRLEEYRDVLEHEQAILSRISHRNIVRVVDEVVRTDGRALALEWCGIDLRRLLASAQRHRRLLGFDFAIAVGVQLCDAVAALHAAHIIHREVRADHVAIASDGTLRVIDFGSASADGGPRFERAARYISPGYPGDMRYRVQYMSPEQVLGLPLRTPTDVFSLAGIVGELAAGEHPVGRTRSVLEAVLRLRDGGLQLPGWVPEPLRNALAPAFDRDPDRRPTAQELRASLVGAAHTERLAIAPDLIAARLLEFGVPV